MSPGLSLAHYRITAKLGEGGMGEVWRATDTKLEREVAIKTLPEALAADPDRMARFTREAKVLASLNHPNIAAIYGVEERAIVMEFVDGAAPRGPMSAEEALPLIHQLIDALEYAHDRGIVHRDLKPANIKITPDGRLKVLDFGLAALAQSSGGEPGDPAASPTLTMRATLAGTILGTAAYMAPEQARGQAVDRRADIWAFGAVVYEVLTGRVLFDAPTVSDTLAAVLTRDPPLDDVPPRFHRLQRLCLARDARQRLSHISGARLLLEPADSSPPQTEVRPTRRAIVPWIAAGASGLAAGAGWWRATRSADRPLLNLSVDLGEGTVSGLRDSFALSPDGTKLVYYDRQGEGPISLAIRDLSQPKGTVLSGTAGAFQPFFSPDSQWIAFFAQGKLMKMPLAGGAPVPVCPARNPRGGHWREDGRIVFAPESAGELFVVGENGGTPAQLTRHDAGEVSHRWPQWLPDGDTVLFTANGSQVAWETAQIAVWSQKTGRKTLVRGGYYGRYLPGGYLVYVREGKLFGVRFNLSRLEIIGRPVALIDDVAASEQSGGGNFDFAKNGLLVYLAGKGLFTARYPFGWMAAGGKIEPTRGVPLDSYAEPHLTLDGKRLAMMLPDGTVVLWDFEREAITRLPPIGANASHLILTPDGRHLIYSTRGADNAILWRRADGSGETVPLFKSAEPAEPSSMSFDGRFLAFDTLQERQTGISILPIDVSDPDHPKAGSAEPLTNSATDNHAIISPDNRWLAYTSFGLGNSELYVRPIRGNGKWPISLGGGRHAQWSRAARQLFYISSDFHLMVVDYSVNGDAFVPGKPRRFSDTQINPVGGRSCFDIAPDGKRVLAFPLSLQAAATGDLRASFLVNFFDEVKRKLP
jgi:serine/threonine-protein kinase